MFDLVQPAEAAAFHTLSLLFNAERANRLVQQHAVNGELPGLKDVLDRIIESVWQNRSLTGLSAEISRSVQKLTVEHLLMLCASNGASSQTRAVARLVAQEVNTYIKSQLDADPNPDVAAHLEYVRSRITMFLEHPDEFRIDAEMPIPPGQPIGMNSTGCGLNP